MTPLTHTGKRRVILISGASSGLGAGMARAWAAQQHDLALVARRRDRLEELRSELTAANPKIRVEIRQLDVSDAAAVRTVFTELDTALGGIDRFVLNAGIGKGAPLGTGKAYANAETVQINALGTLHQAEVALELMRERNAGHLVFISSVAAMRGMMRAETAYAASKAFVTSLAQGIHAELARSGSAIKVTNILPGFIDTDMTRGNTSPLKVGLEAGVKAIVAQVDREVVTAAVPPLPWKLVSPALKFLPEPVTRRFI